MIYVGMTLVRYLPASPTNYPFDPEKHAAARPIGLAMVAWLKAEMTWLFAGVTWSMVALARGHSPDPTAWLTPLALGIIFATVLYHIVRMVRVGKTKADA
ncbi:MAG: hypothetical protein ABSG84_18325 [Acidobacteriaceae bacterium]